MLTILKFEASWCKPCQDFKPVIEKLLEEDADLIVTSIDITDNPQLRADFHVRSVPTLVLQKNRVEIARRVGSATLTELKEWLDEHRRV